MLKLAIYILISTAIVGLSIYTIGSFICLLCKQIANSWNVEVGG